MEPTIKDKYIIWGFIGVAFCLISFFITLIVSAGFNQDNFVRLIVFVCSNILGWLFYLSFQTVIFDAYEIWKIKSGKKKSSAGIIKTQEEHLQGAHEPTAPTLMPTNGEAIPDMSTNIHTEQEPLIYLTGSNIQLITKSELCKSIIADGKELITGNQYGEIRVPELKDPKVYITFKEGLYLFQSTFRGCSALKSIPENLFANCPNVTDFSRTFNGCSALIEIPENLFANCPAVSKFYETFRGCSALKSIPERLFANCPNVTSFDGTFQSCSALTEIPENLFANNQKVTNFSFTFYRCSALKSIPERLFANCPNVTTFGSTFYGCSALKSIPENLFANNPAVTDFGYTFWDCTKLTSIPKGLFANNPAVTSFGSIFSYCSALIEIPEGLFASNPAIIDFSGTFSACSALKSIPDGLFANNPAVTDFGYTFRGCSALTTIPTRLFDNNRNVTDFSLTFWGCKALTSESPYTMIGDKKVHLYERQNYPGQFTAPTSFECAFTNCTGLRDYTQIPGDWID